MHRSLVRCLCLCALAMAPCCSPSAAAEARAIAANASGVHDFDFESGRWRVHHRVKKPDGSWVEYDGTCSNRGLIDGSANVEEHTFDKPNGVTHGIALRAYDATTATWAIWWIDSRNPHAPLDPPVVGRFDGGVGTFYSESAGSRTRFVWSHISADSARWEQAVSTDSGKTWATNWIMEFRRIE